MRIIFMGASDLGWECCRILFEMRQNVVGIFTIPKEFRISWSPAPVTNVRYKSFEDLASAHQVPLITVTSNMSDPSYKESIRKLEPDMLVVIGWYYMLPRSIRELAPLGAVGLHASLLPKYRGGAPLVWAIINGETETGVSLFYFDDGVDTGDIIGQECFTIDFEEAIRDVIQKASLASAKMLRESIPLLASGKAPRLAQNHEAATIVPQRQPKDGIINWNTQTALEVYNWVRAQTKPYPGAFTYVGDEQVKIWKASLSSEKGNGLAPGSVVAVEDGRDGFGVVCADDRLVKVLEVGLVDGITITGNELLATRHILPGQIMGRPMHVNL